MVRGAAKAMEKPPPWDPGTRRRPGAGGRTAGRKTAPRGAAVIHRRAGGIGGRRGPGVFTQLALDDADAAVRDRCLDYLVKWKSSYAAKAFCGCCDTTRMKWSAGLPPASPSSKTATATRPLIDALITEHKQVVGAAASVPRSRTKGGRPERRRRSQGVKYKVQKRFRADRTDRHAPRRELRLQTGRLAQVVCRTEGAAGRDLRRKRLIRRQQFAHEMMLRLARDLTIRNSAAYRWGPFFLPACSVRALENYLPSAGSGGGPACCRNRACRGLAGDPVALASLSWRRNSG